MSNRVVHFEIQADDLDRARKFYEKTFGWKIEKMMSAEKDGMDYWGVKTGEEGTPGINGGMYQREPDKKLNTFDCTIAVDNLDEAIAAVKKNGGKISPMPNGQEKDEIPNVGWLARARDSEGNLFGLIQPTGWQAS